MNPRYSKHWSSELDWIPKSGDELAKLKNSRRLVLKKIPPVK